MKKLKFSKDEGSAFYCELNQKVDAYFKENEIPRTGNTLFRFKMITYFSLDLIFYLLMISSESIVWFYLWYTLMGLAVLLTAFNISHDACHGVAVKSKFWNKLLFQISFNLQGNNAYIWGKNHNDSHHAYTNVEGSDIDVLNNPLFRMTNTQELKWYHKFQWAYAPFLYLFYSLNWFLFRETLMLLNYSSRTIKVNVPVKEAIKLVFFKLLYVGYMIALPIALLPFGWENVIMVFVLNHFIISILFVGVLGVSHVSDYVTHPLAKEDGSMEVSWPKLQMLTSVDYNTDSVFLNWTLGGFNAHALHHLLPNVCHVHYLNLLPIFREVATKYGLTYMEMSYSEALKSHFRFLRKMGESKELKTLCYEK